MGYFISPTYEWGIPWGYNPLILTIYQHFLGHPSGFKDFCVVLITPLYFGGNESNLTSIVFKLNEWLNPPTRSLDKDAAKRCFQSNWLTPNDLRILGRSDVYCDLNMITS